MSRITRTTQPGSSPTAGGPSRVSARARARRRARTWIRALAVCTVALGTGASLWAYRDARA